MADDAVNRGLSAEQANPFLSVNTLKYLGDEVRKLPVWCSAAEASNSSMLACAMASSLSQHLKSESLVSSMGRPRDDERSP